MSVTLHALDGHSTTSLRREVETGGDTVLRSAAVHALMGRNFPFKIAVLRRLIGDDSADPASRLVAVQAVASLGGPDAVAALVEAASADDARVRRQALLSLGRIGDTDTLQAIRRIAECGGADERSAADVARLLIGFRLGLGGELPSPGCDCHDVSGCSPVTVSFRAASDREIELGVWALGHEAFGVDPGQDQAFRIDLEDGRWLLALDRGAVARLVADPVRLGCVLGIVSEDDEEDPDEYALSAVLLAQTHAGRGRLLLLDPAGRALMCGPIEPTSSGFDLCLRGLTTADAPPMEIALRLASDGSVSIDRILLAAGLTRKARLSAVRAGGS